MISASKSTLIKNNLQILRHKVTKNLTNLHNKFCEFRPWFLDDQDLHSIESKPGSCTEWERTVTLPKFSLPKSVKHSVAIDQYLAPFCENQGSEPKKSAKYSHADKNFGVVPLSIQFRCPTVFIRSPHLWRINETIRHSFRTQIKQQSVSSMGQNLKFVNKFCILSHLFSHHFDF